MRSKRCGLFVTDIAQSVTALDTSVRPTKHGWIDHYGVWVMYSHGPQKWHIRWWPKSPYGKGTFGEHVLDMYPTPIRQNPRKGNSYWCAKVTPADLACLSVILLTGRCHSEFFSTKNLHPHAMWPLPKLLDSWVSSYTCSCICTAHGLELPAGRPPCTAALWVL